MEKGQKIKNGFTPDSCVIIKIRENPNIGNLLRCRIDFVDSIVYLNSQTIYEVQKHGHCIDEVYNTLRTTLGTTVVYEKITDEIKNYADYLQNIYPTLHAGDAEILAFAQAKSTTLISCDKGLLEAAKSSETAFVNPDILPCDKIAKQTRTKYYGMVKDAVKKTVRNSEKIRSIAKKPVKKIVWRCFTV